MGELKRTTARMSAPAIATPIRLPVHYETRLRARDLDSVDLVVVHCTELPDLGMAREYAERIIYPDSQTGACGHYYLARGGESYEYVEPGRIAHHCVGYNERSIGIELDHRGRYPDWFHTRHQQMNELYPGGQIDVLLRLLKALRPLFPALRWIAGHDQLDTREIPAADQPEVKIRRKVDPGPLFPWAQVQAALPWLSHAVPD